MANQLIIRRAFAHYFAHLLIFGLFLAVYFYHSYYFSFLQTETKLVFQYLFFIYALIGLPYYYLRFSIFTKSETIYRQDKLYILGSYIKSVYYRKKISKSQRSTTRTALLSFVVKFFFLPIMLNFFFMHWQTFTEVWKASEWQDSFLDFFWQSGYHLIFNLIFLIDTIIFAASYAFEFSFLKNKIKSVDPFVSGWVVALICYPPFNESIGSFLPLTKENPWLFDGLLLDISKILILVAFGIYVWATVALGWKASNLTNRGIIQHGPYRWCRHPAYAAKNIAWWLEFLPFLNWGLIISLLVWNIIYILRGLTEERHLDADSEYRSYCRKVRWRFIPKII